MNETLQLWQKSAYVTRNGD